MVVKASVVIPAYNDEDLIEKIVNGALSQDYKNKEVIVIDDNSTDKTLRILKKFGKRIRVIHHEKNKGFGGAINSALAVAKGGFFVVLQSDFVPVGRNWLSDLVQPLEKDASIDAVMSQRTVNHKTLGFGEKLSEVIAPQTLLNGSGRLVQQKHVRFKADAFKKKLFKNFRFTTEPGEEVLFTLKAKEQRKYVLSNKAKAQSLFSSRQRSVKSVLKKALQYGWPAYWLHKKYGYDGLHTRAFLLSLVSFLSVPLLAFPQAAFYWFAALFALGCFVKIRFNKLGFGVPFSLLSAVFAVPLLLAGQASALALSVLFGNAAFCAYYALVSCARHTRNGYSPAHLPFVFVFVIVWHLLTGIGYVKGFFKTRKLRF